MVSLLAIVLICIGYEGLREISRRYDVQLAKLHAAKPMISDLPFASDEERESSRRNISRLGII